MKRFEEFLGVRRKEAIPINGRCAECDEEVKSGVVMDGELIMVCSLSHETMIKWNFDV